MNLRISVFCFILLLIIWFGMVNMRTSSEKAAASLFDKDSIESSESMTYHEFLAEEKISENEGFFSSFMKKEKSVAKVKFVEVDWRLLSTLDPKTGKFPSKLEFLGKSNVRIDGYVTPLESDNPDEVSEFLFSPFVGACIHVPPPPPNQAIHVILDKPAAFRGLWVPMTLYGRLNVEKSNIESSEGGFQAVTSYSVRYGSLMPSNEEY